MATSLMHVLGVIGLCAVLSESATGGCSSGYYEQVGDLPGWTTVEGRGGGESVSSCDGCAALCDTFSACLSYECSSSQLKCNLNAQADPSDGAYLDYAFCTKSEETTPVSPCDDAQCEDPFVCDADADQFETVSDAQYPCKRDCSLFGIDEYLDQCSTIFPSAVEAVTAKIDGVSANVQEIADVDIPAVTARVEANEGAVATINDELSSVGTLIQALNDIDAATNSSIVAVMSLAESNKEAISVLDQRTSFLENRVNGLGASDAAAAKFVGGQLDAGDDAFVTSYKDVLLGALLATNLITILYAASGRCNKKHKYVSVVHDSESENLNI